ncbi:MAG: sigma-70 family RNA polymerase sigma factor [Chloroflexota bacterium]
MVTDNTLARDLAATAILSTCMESTNDPSDEVLLDRVQARDSEAFALLYDRHSRAAFGLAYRVLGDSGSAEDVVQDAFLALWRRAETYGQTRGSVRAWLLAIVHHRSIDRLRSRSYREDRQGPLDDLTLPPDTADTWEQVRQSLEGQQVREAIQRLPPDQQRSIILAYFGGLTHDEIARRLGLPLGTVKGRLRIGLQKMREFLKSQQGEVSG